MGDVCFSFVVMMFYFFRWMKMTEMEKRADGADASVLFFLRGCANFLAVYVQIR